MYERILVAIDDSEMAEQVLVAAQELATLSGGEVWVIHVREGDPSKHSSPTALSPCRPARGRASVSVAGGGSIPDGTVNRLTVHSGWSRDLRDDLSAGRHGSAGTVGSAVLRPRRCGVARRPRAGDR